MSNIQQLWVDKYRPRTVADYIFRDTAVAEQVSSWIAKQTIPNLLFIGSPGTGKSALARILISNIDVDPIDVLELNASRDGNIETIRTKISDFVGAAPVGKWKVVFLDESDRISVDGQLALRHLMEEHSDYVRFILTGNYGHKIIPALQSRCQEIVFKAIDDVQVALHVAKILIAEGVEFELDVLEYYINAFYPDVRKIINTIELNCVNNKLVQGETSSSQSWEEPALAALRSSNFGQLRRVICNGTIAAGDWEAVYTFLYNNLKECPLTREGSDGWEQAIVTIAEYLYKHAFCADPELNAAALFCQLKINTHNG